MSQDYAKIFGTGADQILIYIGESDVPTLFIIWKPVYLQGMIHRWQEFEDSPEGRAALVSEFNTLDEVHAKAMIFDWEREMEMLDDAEDLPLASAPVSGRPN